MSAVFRSKSEVVATSSTAPTVTEPASAASGDFFVAVYVIAQGSASATSPTGWTDLASGTVGTGFKYLASYVQRGGSAPSLTWGKGSGTFYYEVHVCCVRSDAAQTIVLDAQSSSGATATSGLHQINPPAVTAVASASLAVCFGINWNGSQTAYTAPSGYTIRSRNSAGDDCVMATKSLAASGSEDPAAFGGVVNGTQGYWDGMTLTLTEQASGGGGGGPFPFFRRAAQLSGGFALPGGGMGRHALPERRLWTPDRRIVVVPVPAMPRRAA